LSSTEAVDVKNKGSFAILHDVKTEQVSVTKPTPVQFDWALSHHDSVLQKENASFPSVSSSPRLSKDSVSMEDVMSTCNSIESSDLEFPDDKDSSMASSLHCWADDKLHISESKEVAGLFTCKIGALLVRLFFCVHCGQHFN
jgi:cyclin A